MREYLLAAQSLTCSDSAVFMSSPVTSPIRRLIRRAIGALLLLWLPTVTLSSLIDALTKHLNRVPEQWVAAVSYTHLTLPTNREV